MKYNINKQLILESILTEAGAWDASMVARGNRFNNQHEALSHTFNNNPGQYLLNPFVGGPVNHAGNFIGKHINGAVYNTLRGRNEAPMNMQSGVSIARNGQPYNTQLDVNAAANDQYSQELEQIKTNNPVQYYINPLVAGPVGTSLSNMNTAVTKNLRSITSPTTQVGSTLR